MEKASFRPENMAGDQTRATEVLSDGRKFADELLIMLRSQPLRDANNISCSLSAGDLVSKILNSFEKSLLILQPPSSFVSDEDCQVPVNTVYSAGAPKSEELDSGQTDKIISVRRGCYKRRRTSDIETKVSQSLVEDGHAWRKYGQKSIQNAKHPRNYYRCTHKFEQGCLATKQVQKTEDSSSMQYRTTYYGSHTCKNNYTDHNQFFLDSIDRKDSSSTSVLLSFQSSKKSPPNYRTAINTTTNPSSISSFADRLHPTFGSSSTATELLSPAGSDHADAISSGVYSCTTSTCTPDNTTPFDDELDMMVAGVNFDDDNMAGDGFFLEL